MKLRDIKSLGRYKHTITGKEYNLKKGTRVGRGTDYIYYLYRGTRNFISEEDFYTKKLYTKIN